MTSIYFHPIIFNIKKLVNFKNRLLIAKHYARSGFEPETNSKMCTSVQPSYSLRQLSPQLHCFIKAYKVFWDKKKKKKKWWPSISHRETSEDTKLNKYLLSEEIRSGKSTLVSQDRLHNSDQLHAKCKWQWYTEHWRRPFFFAVE